MNDLPKEIQKILPPPRTPMPMLNQGPPELPTANLYEVVGAVELVPAAQPGASPANQQESQSHKNPEESGSGKDSCS